jgi:hypothetical protein
MSMQEKKVAADNYVSPTDLTAQDTYFMVSFFDEALLIPEITTVVYLGKDIFSEGDERHYFQGYESFKNKTNATDVELIEAAEDKLMNFYDLGGAAALLAECARRRKARGQV